MINCIFLKDGNAKLIDGLDIKKYPKYNRKYKLKSQSRNEIYTESYIVANSTNKNNIESIAFSICGALVSGAITDQYSDRAEEHAEIYYNEIRAMTTDVRRIAQNTGLTISASTNADDEGALTDSTLSALKNAGLNVDNVQDVSGTTHTTGGQDVGTAPQSQNQPVDNGGLTADEKEFDFDGDGVLNQYEKESYEAMKDFDYDKFWEENSTGGKLDWNI